jgi:hypothetical protein
MKGDPMTLPYQRHSVTSLQAALAALPAAAPQRDRVLACVRACGPVTDEAIADLLGMNPSTARPRRIELQRAGLIAEADELVPTRAGRLAVAWIIPPAATPTLPGI